MTPCQFRDRLDRLFEGNRSERQPEDPLEAVSRDPSLFPMAVLQDCLGPCRSPGSWQFPQTLGATVPYPCYTLNTLGPLNMRTLEIFLGYAGPCLMDLLTLKI
jgi:hypothetical protein